MKQINENQLFFEKEELTGEKCIDSMCNMVDTYQHASPKEQVMEERTHDERVLAICGAYLELAEKKREKFLKMLQKEGFITESEFCDLLKESEGIQE